MTRFYDGVEREPSPETTLQRFQILTDPMAFLDVDPRER